MDVSCPFLVLTSFLTQWNGYIIKVCKPNNFESHKFLNLSFTNIQGLCLELVWCDPFLESNSPDILAPCETNLNKSIVSGIFSRRSYLPLVQKDPVIQEYFLAVYLKKRLPFAWGSTCFHSLVNQTLMCLINCGSNSFHFFSYTNISQDENLKILNDLNIQWDANCCTSPQK